MAGRTIAHYLLEEKLGEGGMGTVYRARDTRSQRAVALKVLRGRVLKNPERSSRFLQDSRAAAALQHPNIAAVYEIDSAGGVDFIAMELVTGETLDQLIGGQPLMRTEILHYAVQAAGALAAAHAAGIVHRDLKPSNLMVTEQGQVKVLDFALSRLGELVPDDTADATLSMAAPDTPVSRQGATLATVAYVSPERAGGRPVEPRSDIFSFGAVLYEMATGRRAFTGPTRLAILTAILQTDPPPVRQIAPAVSRGLEKIISRCLHKDPARRFPTMDSVKKAVEALQKEPQLGRNPVAWLRRRLGF